MLILNEKDNVSTSLETKHKIALSDIKKGEAVIKYGFQIGLTTSDIKAGETVHVHNLKSAISIENEYKYQPKTISKQEKKEGIFSGYLRNSGKAGIRNEIWIINTVGCTNKLSEKIATQAGRIHSGKVDGIYAVTHPYGCSQLGDDHENTIKILTGMALHPNAGGVLVLGLGCENNSICGFKKRLGKIDESRMKFLTAQECEDEVEAALKLINEIVNVIQNDKRVPISFSKLAIGLKCGGSDALSGITANPLVGLITDRLNMQGGTAVLTETPEMFGAETILMNRCENRHVFDKTVKMINSFKQYFISHGQNVYDNPSPGNKDGGITTLEEKSLGCV